MEVHTIFISLLRSLNVISLSGSIPEQDEEGKLYNTATIYAPDGTLVDIHRKVHLFDIDIPGKITFKVSYLHLHSSKVVNRSSGEHNFDRRIQAYSSRHGYLVNLSKVLCFNPLR